MIDHRTASWGRYPRVENQSLVAHPFVDTPWPGGGRRLLARGNGRSYGDSAANAEGILLATTGMDRLLAFDPSTGLLRAEAGVLLAEVIDRFLPARWFPRVVPGTRWITLGGAVANDVHGKNHPAAGSFGRHVTALGLRRSDGRHLELRPGDASGLFEATVGGLGLTGLITWVEFRLGRVPGFAMRQTKTRFGSVDDYFDRVADAPGIDEHRVAWIDCLASGASLGRGVLTTARHAEGGKAPRGASRGGFGVPIVPPFSLVNRASLVPFNAATFALAPKRPTPSVVDPVSFFFPLDGIAHWNRLYGPSGFVQYQCVVPAQNARPGIRSLLEAIARSGRGSMLAVLKEFGALASPGLLSFPMAGTTLALDFPSPDAELFRLFDRLDAIVAECGGRLYPAKDARWPGWRFRDAYPEWSRVDALRDPAFSSSFWRRVTE